MFRVENNSITITKGDSGKINLKFKNGDGTEYIPALKDKIVFSVKRKKEAFLPVVLEKKGTEIVLEKNDTAAIASGVYVYDVFIETAAGERYTAIEGKFEIRKAAHDE